jgi:hypothetical protein
MKQAFAEDIELEVVVKTDAISFPSSTTGLGAVEDVLVRRFGVESENIYTFCLCQPPEAVNSRFHCQWLVGMSARATGQIRVGCGGYDWHFNDGGKVGKLVINIDVMKILSGSDLDAVMAWLSSLPYPWCSPSLALTAFPANDELSDIAAYLKQVR